MKPIKTLVKLFLIQLAVVGSHGYAADSASDGQPFAENTIADIKVLDQDGQGRNFYTDLIAGKTVAVNFIFTSCKMACPLLGYKFGQLRRLLGVDAGSTYHLVSITTDAPFDTPQKLKEWSENFNGGEGWTQVTGTKQNMDALLKNLEAFSVDKIDHSTLLLLINDKAKQLKWIDGNSDPRVMQAALSSW